MSDCRIFRGLLVLIALALPALAAAQDGRRVALVLGNAAYEAEVPLRNPGNDAREMAAALERLGFEVTLATDQAQSASLDTIEGFVRTAVDAEIALFYYSGHGLQLDDANYLLPVDLDVTSPSSVQYRALDAGLILADLEAVAQTSIMILDACRDNPFADKLARSLPRSRSASLKRGLQPMVPKGRRSLVAYAAAAGTTADDGRGDHSPYTEALLDEIEAPGVEVGLMFRRVAGRVQEITRDDQQPELLIRLPEPIYLAAAPQTVATAPEAPEADLPPVPEPEPEPEAGDTTAESGETGTTETATSEDDAQAAEEEEMVEEAPAPDPLLLVELPAPTEGIRRASDPAPLPIPPGQSWGYPRIEPGLIYAPRAPWTPPRGSKHAEAEPNDSRASAQPAGVSDTVTLSLAERGDEDWFRLTIGSAGVLHARIYDSPPELDMWGLVLDYNGTTVADWQGAERPGADMDAAFDIPGPGVYILRLKDGSSDAASSQPMTLEMSFSGSEDGFEPNDSFATARPVPLDFEATTAIYPRGDNDYYRMNVTRPGELRVLIEDVPEAMDVFVLAQNLDHKTVADWQGPKRDGGDTEAMVHFGKPGVYFLRLKDGSDNAWSPDPFRIETRFFAAEDTYEPNDRMLAAREIPPSGEHVLAIFPRGDNDYLSFTADHPGTLEFLIEDVAEDMDVYGQVYDVDGKAISDWIGPKRDGGDTEGEVDIARPGRYFLRLKDGSDNATSPRGVTLTTRYLRAADQYEPNDTRELASPLTIGGELALNILPRGDEDFFVVNATQAGQLNVEISDVDEALDVFVLTMDLDGRTVADWQGPKRDGGDTPAAIDLPAPGTYFLRIKDGGSNARASQPFTLRTGFAPALDAYEPNGSLRDARLVEPSGSDWLNTFPRGDNDYFYFHLPRAGWLDLLADQVPENLDIWFQLHDAEGRAISNWIGAERDGGDAAGTVELASGGWYWLRIKDGSDNASNIDPFRLTRRYRPAR